MKSNTSPKAFFIIKRKMQKSDNTGIYFDSIVTSQVLKDICEKVTGQSNYSVQFVDNDYKDDFLQPTYNKGRLVILHYGDEVSFISISDQQCSGRNSGIQSVPTAFNQYYLNEYRNKKLYFYFVPCVGNNATDYYYFMYRLMVTSGFKFLNVPSTLKNKIVPFSSIDDLIRARKANGDKNSANNATYIVKTGTHEYEIFGKTYGANKYDTTLIGCAISALATDSDKITLYEFNEKDLKELPLSSLTVLRAMRRINIVNIDDEIEKKELESNNSLRSPRFNARLLERLGERRCVLCGCCISEIIQGAHIWPVADIKRDSLLSDKEKLDYATDGENGLWMCQNHHKLFDSNIIILSDDGGVKFSSNLESDEVTYLKSITKVSKLSSTLITQKFEEYVRKRYMS